MNETQTLKSGAELQLQIAAFSVSNKLFQAVINEIRLVDIKIDGVKSFEDLLTGDLNGVKNVLLQIAGSKSVEMAIHECMKCCLYKGVRLDAAKSFEPQDARQDYLPVAWEVMKFNLSPFFGGIDLSSMTGTSPAKNSPASPST